LGQKERDTNRESEQIQGVTKNQPLVHNIRTRTRLFLIIINRVNHDKSPQYSTF